MRRTGQRPFTVYMVIGMQVNERFFTEMCRAGMLVNVVMFVFNLFPLASARWWPDLGRASALEASRAGLSRRALWVFYRHGAGDCGGTQHAMDAPADGAHV